MKRLGSHPVDYFAAASTPQACTSKRRETNKNCGTHNDNIHRSHNTHTHIHTLPTSSSQAVAHKAVCAVQSRRPVCVYVCVCVCVCSKCMAHCNPQVKSLTPDRQSLQTLARYLTLTHELTHTHRHTHTQLVMCVTVCHTHDKFPLDENSE